MITTVTLNASIDKAYQIHGYVERGSVIRVLSCRNTAGGKGLNVARVLRLCGEESAATGLVGGHNGAYLEELLQMDGIENRFVHISGETRCCINILDEGQQSTELLEPGVRISPGELEMFIKKFQVMIADSPIVILSGSVPLGVDRDIYCRLIYMAKQNGRMVLLDTSGDFLREGIKACPDMIKPNKEELESLVGRKLQTINEVKEAAVRLHNQGIQYVVVSLGKEGALMVCEEGTYLSKPPYIKVVNTVGCGDSLIAAFAAAYSKRLKPMECLRYAVAVSAANAMSECTGFFDMKDMREILCRILIETL